VKSTLDAADNQQGMGQAAQTGKSRAGCAEECIATARFTSGGNVKLTLSRLLVVLLQWGWVRLVPVRDDVDAVTPVNNDV
jgi:hypothetical protein